MEIYNGFVEVLEKGNIVLLKEKFLIPGPTKMSYVSQNQASESSVKLCFHGTETLSF